MTSPNDPDRLSTSLRRLQTRPASADFTERVLGALERRIAARRRRRIAAVAVALPATVALVAGLALFAPSAETSRSAQVEELRRRHEALEAELAQLEAARDRSRAVLYVGTGDSYDLVLDLEPLLERSQEAPLVPALQDLRAQPARVLEASRRRP